MGADVFRPIRGIRPLHAGRCNRSASARGSVIESGKVMESGKSRDVLSYVANILVIVVAVAFIASWWARSQAPQSVLLPKDPKIGSKLPIRMHFRQGANIVLVLSGSCHFCSESIPFYLRLIPIASERGFVGILFREDTNAGIRYATEHGLRASAVAGQIRLPWRVGTPTVLLCDEQGKIVRAWVGKLGHDQEEEVIRAVRAANAGVAGSRSSGQSRSLTSCHRTRRRSEPLAPCRQAIVITVSSEKAARCDEAGASG